jgi:hypothetical protein
MTVDKNTLFYGDNLSILREYIQSETTELPPPSDHHLRRAAGREGDRHAAPVWDVQAGGPILGWVVAIMQ